MRKLYMVLLGAATITAPALGAAPESTVTGSAAIIRSVVSGKTCVGEDTLTFGESVPGSPGTFERSGRATGTYSIGYGTVLIRRGKALHGHVTSVSAQDHLLYMSTGTYRCERAWRLGVGSRAPTLGAWR